MTVLRVNTAIVGGGLMGCWTALMLRRRDPGHCVCVIEKGKVGAQASGVNYGNLRIQGRHPGQLPLSLRAASLWERLPDLIGEGCEFDATGHLYAARDDAREIAKVETAARQASEAGLATELLDARALAQRWPWLNGFSMASWSPRDAIANPRLVTPAVARAARAHGALIHEDTAVHGAARTGAVFRIDAAGGLTIEADTLINAAGAWAPEVAGWFGEGAPIVPAGPPQFVTDAVPYFIRPSVQAVDGTVIFRQVRQGHVVVAGYPRSPSDPVANRAPVDARKIVNAMGHLLRAVPALEGATLLRVWSGIEGYLPDMLPVIGPSGTTPRLVHAFGFCGHGFQLAPGVGDVLADLVLEGSSRTPLDRFSIGRFADGSAEVAEHFTREFDRSLQVQAVAHPGAQRTR
ncbi:FAD-binding oxidoreductase [Elioraea sp.]|uniref:NAD(P)/FAD-dependent oxidoreductase n=1 Tax=Elioraea sp. TaxID=2185103 RepID=UPI0025BA8F2A|nr:FAD-dependent oxidoreductase [Elioraea sp.]